MADDTIMEESVKEDSLKEDSIIEKIMNEAHEEEGHDNESDDSEHDKELHNEAEEDVMEVPTEADEQERGDDIMDKDKAFVEEAWGEMPGEAEEGEIEVEEDKEKIEEVLEEEGELEEEVVDPNAPYNLSDKSEAKKAPFSLNEEQMEEVQQLWDAFQDYTPAYADLDQFVTPKELKYMLRALNLHTHTPEQTMELVKFCVRPPHHDNHVNFEQFVWIVTIRQRDMPTEEEIRLALEAFDPDNTGLIDREYFREFLSEHGKKMNTDAFIREIDMTNDGTLGKEEIVATICVELNRDDIDQLLKNIYPEEEEAENNIEALTT